jgi:CheY-like chemotaxis protein
MAIFFTHHLQMEPPRAAPGTRPASKVPGRARDRQWQAFLDRDVAAGGAKLALCLLTLRSPTVDVRDARLSKQFLVIEDDADSRDAFCALIQITGHEAVGVENGEAALAFLRSHPAPTGIVLDMRMPVMDGWQFRQIQCADPRLKDIPVLVVSAEDRFRNQALSSGVKRFIEKPIDPDELLLALADLPDH